ncbi:MAG: hypothetical protein NUV97_01360 [archaeon]|nr:hypothetical protein [archaeon]
MFNPHNVTLEQLGLSRNLIIVLNPPPLHYNSTGTAGTLAFDDDYLYVCVSTDRWIRIAGTKNFDAGELALAIYILPGLIACSDDYLYYRATIYDTWMRSAGSKNF